MHTILQVFQNVINVLQYDVLVVIVILDEENEECVGFLQHLQISALVR